MAVDYTDLPIEPNLFDHYATELDKRFEHLGINTIQWGIANGASGQFGVSYKLNIQVLGFWIHSHVKAKAAAKKAAGLKHNI